MLMPIWFSSLLLTTHWWKVDAMTDIHLARNVISRPIRGHHEGGQSEARIISISTNWMRELSHHCEPVTVNCLCYIDTLREKCPSFNPVSRRRTFQPSISKLSAFHLSRSQVCTLKSKMLENVWTDDVVMTNDHVTWLRSWFHERKIFYP